MKDFDNQQIKLEDEKKEIRINLNLHKYFFNE